ncbi:MAG: Uncharacterised protein [Synechococcus sp. MIT S9220]|nr:MAG: Uncharacterised protein [Synechococcus sp. MIT S9220]
MPCPKVQITLEELSKQACRGLHAYRLPPHITFYSDRLNSEATAIDRLRHIAENSKPVLLRPRTIEAGPLFTMSVVLRFGANKELNHWYQLLRARSPNKLDYNLDPHLSLIYSDEALIRKQAMARQLPLPSPALFNRIRAVRHPLTISTAADIKAVTTIDESMLISMQ